MIKEKAGRLRSRCELWRPGNSFNLPNSFHSDLYYSFPETPWIVTSSSSPLDQRHVWQWLVPWLVGNIVVACLGNGDLFKEAQGFGEFSSLLGFSSLFYDGIRPHSWGIAQEAMFKSCRDNWCLGNTRLLTPCILHTSNGSSASVTISPGHTNAGSSFSIVVREVPLSTSKCILRLNPYSGYE